MSPVPQVLHINAPAELSDNFLACRGNFWGLDKLKPRIE
jgi:hypothetical protein